MSLQCAHRLSLSPRPARLRLLGIFWINVQLLKHLARDIGIENRRLGTDFLHLMVDGTDPIVILFDVPPNHPALAPALSDHKLRPNLLLGFDIGE